MIRRLFSEQKLTKKERKNFIPFQNERNFMGTLISGSKNQNRDSRDAENRDIQMIENLKKTTKEYLFEKKFKKMADKLKKIEESMHRKEPNYDQEIDKCFQTLDESGFGHRRVCKEKNYIEFRQELDQKVSHIKSEIINKIQMSRQQLRKNKRCRTFKLSEEFQEKQRRKQTKVQLNLTQNVFEEEQSKQNQAIFESIGTKSKFMRDVTNHGIKYKQLVQVKKINPWKKWYVKQEIEIFPGTKIRINKLQKSIY